MLNNKKGTNTIQRSRGEPMQKQYYTNADYSIDDRAKDDSITDSLRDEFVPSTFSDDLYIPFDFCIDSNTNKLIDLSQYELTLEERMSSTYIRVHKMIPSCLALYRLICAYGEELKINPSNGYKSVWNTNLEHKETGVKIWVGDIKAGFSLSVYVPKNIPIEKAKEVGIRFLSLLIDKNFTHPYDGVIAGSVA